MEPVFKAYRKTTPTVARVLTELDYDARGGIIQTNEGPASFLPGDSLARDAKGEWSIPVSMIRHGYKRVSVADEAGFVQYQSLSIRYAAQMDESFEVDGLKGEAHDYLVTMRRESRSGWPVDRELFEASYELAEEENTSCSGESGTF